MTRIFFAAALMLSGAAAAADVQQLVTTCAACHGERGAKPIQPAYPILAGQYANYLEHSLKAYRSGERKNAIMMGQAANLSDADIKALAQYFAQQETVLHTPALPEHKGGQ